MLLNAKLIETSIFNVNGDSLPGRLITETFAKRAPGLKTGVGSDIFWSEIRSVNSENRAAHPHQEFPVVPSSRKHRILCCAPVSCDATLSFARNVDS